MNDLRGFLVVAPSCVGVNEPFSLKIKALTAPYHVDWKCYTIIPRLAGPFNLSPRGIAYMDNVPPDWNGQVIIEAGDYQGASELIFDGKQGAVAPQLSVVMESMSGFRVCIVMTYHDKN